MEIILTLVLLIVGWVFGRAAERKHYRSLEERERAVTIPVRGDELEVDELAGEGALVTGSAVIAQDYFKQVVSGLQNVVGGSVRTYESLMDRARREAILRMTEHAQAMGADEIVNLRVESYPVSKGGAVEILAYGTAVRHAVRQEG